MIKKILKAVINKAITASGLAGTIYLILTDNNPLFIGIFSVIFLFGLIWCFYDFIKKKYIDKYPLIEKSLFIGLKEIFPQEDSNKNHAKLIEGKLISAKNIFIFHTTARGFFVNHRKELINAVRKNNAHIKVLIGKKGSKFLSDVAKLEITKGIRKTKEDAIHSEIDIVEEIVSELNLIHENHVKICYFETEFRTSITLIESMDNKKWGWITLTLPPLKAQDTISFEIEDNNNTDTIYKQCKLHFDEVWEKVK